MINNKIKAKDLGKFERRFSANLKRELDQVLPKAQSTIVQMFTVASSGIKDTGAYQNSWVGKLRSQRVLAVYNKVWHTQFIEFGRRPGAKMPPLEPIRDWLSRHGGSPKNAFIVARSIARRGIKPRPVLATTAPKAKRYVWTRVIAAYMRAAVGAKV